MFVSPARSVSSSHPRPSVVLNQTPVDERLIDKFESMQQSMERRLAAIENRQKQTAAGWEFREVRWNKNDSRQLFVDMAQDGWKPLASDAALCISNGCRDRDPRFTWGPILTFYRPLSIDEVALRAQALSKAEEEKKQAKIVREFAKKHVEANKKSWFSRT